MSDHSTESTVSQELGLRYKHPSAKPFAEVRVRPRVDGEGKPIHGQWLCEVGIDGVWAELRTTGVDVDLKPGAFALTTIKTLRASIEVTPFQ